tara:strand:+ start:2209 stop:2415 length:207 start_codon:yes stop_codon:yes gene_type:complete
VAVKKVSEAPFLLINGFPESYHKQFVASNIRQSKASRAKNNKVSISWQINFAICWAFAKETHIIRANF